MLTHVVKIFQSKMRKITHSSVCAFISLSMATALTNARSDAETGIYTYVTPTVWTEKRQTPVLSWFNAAPGETMDAIAGTPQAKSFTLNAIDGSAISLDDYRGKFVLINFWATWCAPCRREMPAINNLHHQLHDQGLEIIGVHVGPNLAGVKKFLQMVSVDFTILVDENMELSNWEVLGLPTTFLVNPQGQLIYKAIGERQWDAPAMVEFLADLIVSDARVVVRQSGYRTGKLLPPAPMRRTSWFAIFASPVGQTSQAPVSQRLTGRI